MRPEAERRAFLLTLLSTCWVLSFGYGLYVLAQLLLDGAGVALNPAKVGEFLGFQGIAAMIAVAIFGVSRDWPPGSGIRKMALGPVGLAALGLGLIVVRGV